MDLSLIAVVDWSAILQMAWNIAKVAIGLGFVIFVHELGHFIVAKLCGVKCEKFYVGFDIPIKIGPLQLPSRLGRFRWGETEYGVGILPLGGYVKMLGQDDDPRMAQQEAERIRIKKEAGAEMDNSVAASSAEEDDYVLDPRSFPAKPVPHRMAIISAGVIMNLIFAVLFATYAFSVGVPFTPTEVGGTVPGSPAWQAGLEPRSRIIKIGANGQRSEKLRFDWDLSNGGVGLAQDQEDLPLLVRTEDGEEKLYKIRPVMAPKTKAKIPMIGVAPAKTLTIGDITRGSAAAQASLQQGDRIIAANGEPVADGYVLEELLARLPDKELVLTIERPSDSKKKEEADVERIDAKLAPNPLRRLGLIMTHGPVLSIRPGTPAERAGLKIGDLLVSIDGQPLHDPMTLPAVLRKYYDREVTLGVRRGEETLQLTITPEQPTAADWTLSSGFPMAAEAIGAAYEITRTVRDVVPGGPADNAGIQPGDTMVGVSFRSEDPEDKKLRLFNRRANFPLADGKLGWVFVFEAVQQIGPDAYVTLSYERGGQQTDVELKPIESEVNNSHRGMHLKLVQEINTAESWRDALALGFRQTKEDAQRVVTFLKKLFTGGLSPTSIGGPLAIIAVAGTEASQGVPRLLMFLTFLSANLAVINFLPIPALDGGHMLFLLAEGIRGKPVNERTQVALTLAGVACLLGLMIFVFGLDIHRLFL